MIRANFAWTTQQGFPRHKIARTKTWISVGVYQATWKHYRQRDRNCIKPRSVKPWYPSTTSSCSVLRTRITDTLQRWLVVASDCFFQAVFSFILTRNIWNSLKNSNFAMSLSNAAVTFLISVVSYRKQALSPWIHTRTFE